MFRSKTVKMNKIRIDLKTGFGYAFIHFSMEVLCFFFLYRVFGGSDKWWYIAIVYDAIAFAGQVPVGAFCEKHPRFSPGICGALMLIGGAALGFFTPAALAGFLIICVGNALLHISGALITLRASAGRLSESGIFVGGGAFGVITGRLLGSDTAPVWIPFVLMAVALAVVIYMDMTESIGNRNEPCMHDIAAGRPAQVIILILAGVIALRSYIGNGIPMQWKKTTIESIMLFVAMGTGKMAGGVLADLFGARLIGAASCVLAVPFLLLGNDLMWVSLVGILLFSMTMAIALGGIVSVLKHNPGVAFGITTLSLFLGTLPVFFIPMPKGIVMNVILALLSLLSAVGIFYTVTDRNKILGK